MMQNNGLVRLIYNHNPFYLISASLVLYGTHTSMAVDHYDEVNIWPLASALVSCTLILAVTAFLIVRFGKVWDDARSIFMILLLMFFAVSVSFDELCITNTNLAIVMLSIGFMFTVAVTEGLLHSLKIKLPKQFRFPFYLMLALTFFYPLAFVEQTIWYNVVDPRWLLILFPVASAVAMLTLLPAIRAGSNVFKKNGTPWVWPLYPWSIFVFLCLGLAGRAMLLCLAFDPSSGPHSIWNVFFLAPVCFAAAMLMLEMGVVEQKRLLRQLGLGMAMVTIPLSLWLEPRLSSQVFMGEFVGAVGSPVWIASVALLVFYLIAWLRGVERSEAWLAVLIVTCMFIDRRQLALSTEVVATWPVFSLAGFHFFRGLQFKDSLRLLAASFLCSVGAMIVVNNPSSAGLEIVAGAHVLLVGALLTGLIGKDKLADQLNAICAAVLVLFSVFAAAEAMLGYVRHDLASMEIGMMGLLAILFWKLNRDRLFAFSAGASLVVGAMAFTPVGVKNFANEGQQRFVIFILIAVFCFMIGAFISSLKAGLSRHLNAQTNRLFLEVVGRFRVTEKTKPNIP